MNEDAPCLHRAIKQADLQEVEAVLSRNGVGAKDICLQQLANDGNALHLAAKNGNTDVLRAILAAGVDINVPQTEAFIIARETALHIAVGEGHIDIVKFLLSKGADPDAQDSEGHTALHTVCQTQSEEILRLLLEAGSNINKADNRGQTPLQMSILRCPEEMTQCLIDGGSDVNVEDSDGQTPLHYAAEWGACNVVSSLISKGAAVNHQDKQGLTPLHMASDDATSQLLVKYGGDVHIRDKKGRRPNDERLDMNKLEYQNINKALSKHLDLSREKQTDTVPQNTTDSNVSKKKIRFGPPLQDSEMQAAKLNVLAELHSKTPETN